MRLKPSNIVLPILLSGLCLSLPAISAVGQGERTGVDGEVPSVESKVVPDVPESENKATFTKTATVVSIPYCDSASQNKNIKPVVSKVVESNKPADHPKSVESVKSADKNPRTDDPLSFNFLYYIIERFKMSDMTE